VVAVVLGACLAAAVAARAAEPASGAGFTVARLVVCAAVEKREPVGTAEKFPASQKSVTAFLEADGVTADTPVTFVWSAGGKEVRRIDAKLGAGRRWRTWTVKALKGVTGPWKVEVLGADGKPAGAAAFVVE
jgi:hypothetical protein